MPKTNLLLLLRPETSIPVNNLNIQLISTSNDLPPLASGHIGGNLSSVLLVVHQQHVQVRNIGDTELQETVGEHVLGDLVGSITDLGHGAVTLEPPANTVINTPGLSPGLLLFLERKRGRGGKEKGEREKRRERKKERRRGRNEGGG